jgi:hypothetical protein
MKKSLYHKMQDEEETAFCFIIRQAGRHLNSLNPPGTSWSDCIMLCC